MNVLLESILISYNQNVKVAKMLFKNVLNAPLMVIVVFNVNKDILLTWQTLMMNA